jgi:hypothetical protein
MPPAAGLSAREGYRAELRNRRRRLALCSGLAVAAVGITAIGVAGRTGVEVYLLAAATLASAWLLRPPADPERWLRGAAGEEATARVLSRLPSRTWVVRHDLAIPGSRANVDHLVAGPTGVWCIDTKTTRAEIRARWRAVRFGDRRLDAGPVRWEAEVMADRLGVPVRPLIVVHGQGLRRRGGHSGRVRVVPPARLLRTIRRGRRRLSTVDIRRIQEKVAALNG